MAVKSHVQFKLVNSLISQVNKIYKSLFTTDIKLALSEDDIVILRDSNDKNNFKRVNVSAFTQSVFNKTPFIGNISVTRNEGKISSVSVSNEHYNATMTITRVGGLLSEVLIEKTGNEDKVVTVTRDGESNISSIIIGEVV